jgi:hypothetical protein
MSAGSAIASMLAEMMMQASGCIEMNDVIDTPVADARGAKLAKEPGVNKIG